MRVRDENAQPRPVEGAIERTSLSDEALVTQAKNVLNIYVGLLGELKSRGIMADFQIQTSFVPNEMPKVIKWYVYKVIALEPTPQPTAQV